MIILKHKDIDKDIIFNKREIYNLVIEDPKYLRIFLNKLLIQINDGEEFFLPYNNDTLFSLKNISTIVYSPFLLNIDEKKATTLIQKNIANQLNYEQDEEYKILIQELNEFILDKIVDYPIKLEFNMDLPYANLLKTLSLSYSEEILDDVERFIQNIKVLNTVFGIKIFFLINLKDYFNLEEIQIIYKELKKLDIDFVLLSNNYKKEKLTEEYIVIIDKDLCEIHIESSL